MRSIKLTRKTKFLTLIFSFLMIGVCVSSIFQFATIGRSTTKTTDSYVMKYLEESAYNISDYVNFTGPLISLDGGWRYFRILIDETNVSHTWEKYATDYDWCSGSGTFSDPYVIENVYIDALKAGGAIGVYNSYGKYFIIRNCWLTNAKNHEFGCGIYMEYVDNGTITNNVITKVFHGVQFQFDCYNITVSNNIMITDNRMGSRGLNTGWDTYNSTLYNNKMLDFYHGIGFFRSDGLKIDSNLVENWKFVNFVSGSPIHLYRCNNSKVTKNVLAGVFAAGYITVTEIDSGDNVIENNYVTTNQSLSFDFDEIYLSTSGGSQVQFAQGSGPTLTLENSYHNYVAYNCMLIEAEDGGGGGEIPGFEPLLILGIISAITLIILRKKLKN